MRILLGLDVGGTNVKAVLATADGRALRRAFESMLDELGLVGAGG